MGHSLFQMCHFYYGQLYISEVFVNVLCIILYRTVYSTVYKNMNYCGLSPYTDLRRTTEALNCT